MMNLKYLVAKMVRSIALVLGLATLTLATPVVAGTEPDDSAALAGLETAKSVFLINKPTASQTARYLKGIRNTHEALAAQGVVPKTVLVFLGKPVQFITSEPKASIAEDQKEALASIAATTEALKKLGVRMEVCNTATKYFGVDNASLLPGMEPVGNGFISLIGWQSKGHVPMTF